MSDREQHHNDLTGAPTDADLGGSTPDERARRSGAGDDYDRTTGAKRGAWSEDEDAQGNRPGAAPRDGGSTR